MNNALSFSLPEDLPCMNPKAEAGVPFDAITCAIDRADSVLTLLEDHFENESSRLANHVIAAVFWDVRGALGLKHLKQWIVIQRPMQTQSNSIIDQSGRKRMA